MASSKENLLAQVFLAIGHGAGNARLSQDSVSWLYDRYSTWLDTRSSNGDTPQEVWPKYGETFLENFTRIGRAIASRNPGFNPAPALTPGVEEIVCSVEGESDCPYCPSPKG